MKSNAAVKLNRANRDAVNEDKREYEAYLRRPTRDLSVFMLYPIAADSIASGSNAVSTALYGPMADSPIARRLQCFVAGCVEGGGLDRLGLLRILTAWAQILLGRIPKSNASRASLALAFEQASAVLTGSADLGQVSELRELLGESDASDFDDPVVYGAHTLIIAASDALSPAEGAGQSFDALYGWGYSAAMLGAISCFVPDSELEVTMEACAVAAYEMTFKSNFKHWAPEPSVSDNATTSTGSPANSNAKKRRRRA